MVQVAGGLISQQQAGLVHQGSGNRDTLLLTARKLPRIMLQSMAQANCLEHRKGSLPGPWLTCDFKRQTDVPKRRQARQQVKRLENNAKVLTAPVGKSVGVHVTKALVAHENLAAGGALQTGEQKKQGGFPAA